MQVITFVPNFRFDANHWDRVDSLGEREKFIGWVSSVYLENNFTTNRPSSHRTSNLWKKLFD